MRDECPTALAELLARLGLADGEALRVAAGRAKRLARGLPIFESIWIDALVQTGCLTRFQADHLRDGRGQQIEVGPYLLVDRIGSPGPFLSFRALERQSHESVRLTVAELGDPADEVLHRLHDLIQRFKRVQSPGASRVQHAVLVDDRAIIAAEPVNGIPADQWVARHGRLPPPIVLDVARQMVETLSKLHDAGIVHGDLAPREIWLAPSGEIVIGGAGIRPALRACETFTAADLVPEAYETVAPERIENVSRADYASDIYACGITWWHLLTARSPWPLAASLLTLRAIRSGSLPDVGRLISEVPNPLSSAIAACCRREPANRPQSLAEVQAILGRTTNHKREARFKPAMDSHTIADSPNTSSGKISAVPSLAAALAIGLLLAIVYLSAAGRLASAKTEMVTQQTEQAKISSAERPSNSAKRLASMPFAGAPRSAITRTSKPRPEIASAPTRASSSEFSRAPSGDANVRRANYLDLKSPTRDLILPGDRPLHLESISPQPGQTIRGAGNQRPQIWLNQKGLALRVDGISFRGIDFVWNGNTGKSKGEPAMLELSAYQVSFDNCSFQVAVGSQHSPVVLRRSAAPTESATRLPTVAVRFSNCVIDGVTAAVEQVQTEAIVVEATNVLCLRTATFLRLQSPPRHDEPVMLSLDGCTMRDSGNVLSFERPWSNPVVGPLIIRTRNCVFAPARANSLLRFATESNAIQLLERTKWDGEGSVLAGAAAIVAIGNAGTSAQPLPEESISTAGLVRSRIEFSGDALHRPIDSNVSAWSAPLVSSDPPGAHCIELILPTLATD